MTKKKDRYKFQLTVDTDSIFISQAPGKKKSRVILTNLENEGLKQIAKSVIDAGLSQELIELLADDIYTEPVEIRMFTLYFGLEQPPTKALKDEVQQIVSSHCDAFTLFDANGYFKNEKVHTLLIQIGAQNHEVAYKCAEELRANFDKEGVGVMESSNYKRLIEKN